MEEGVRRGVLVLVLVMGVVGVEGGIKGNRAKQTKLIRDTMLKDLGLEDLNEKNVSLQMKSFTIGISVLCYI